MSTARFDLSAFEGPVGAGARVPLPEPLRRRRRGLLITFVICLAAGVAGAVSVILGSSVWDRPIFTLIAAGVVGAPTCLVTLARIDPSQASRIGRFADDNGFGFEVAVESAGWRGSNFAIGHDHRRLMVVNGEIEGRGVEFGNLSFTIAMGRSTSVLPGYVAIGLPARLPHTIIESNRPLRNRVARHPYPEDRVEIPGGDALRVYAPDRAAHVVSAIFTPQAIDVLTRVSRRHGIEILDDVMYLYSRRPVSTGSGRRWGKVLADTADVCALIGSSPVWSVMNDQPKKFQTRVPELRDRFEDFGEARAKRIIWACFAAFIVLVTVVVAWNHDW